MPSPVTRTILAMLLALAAAVAAGFAALRAQQSPAPFGVLVTSGRIDAARADQGRDGQPGIRRPGEPVVRIGRR